MKNEKIEVVSARCAIEAYHCLFFALLIFFLGSRL